MPRANRHFLSNHVQHITHRCHQKEFLLKFARDRRRWLQWLFEASKRYGLSVLNHRDTSNHYYLILLDATPSPLHCVRIALTVLSQCSSAAAGTARLRPSGLTTSSAGYGSRSAGWLDALRPFRWMPQE